MSLQPKVTTNFVAKPCSNIYIYIYIIIIFIHHDLKKNLMNNSTSYLMSMLCKSSTNKYMVMVKNVIDKIIKNMINYHCTPLVRWSLHKYKCLWGVRGKGQGSSLQERDSHTYTLRLGQNSNSILYKKYIYIYIYDKLFFLYIKKKKNIFIKSRD